MDISNKMWFFFGVALMVCLADQAQSKASRPVLRPRRMVGGTLAPHVPWQAMVYLTDSRMDGGYAGGALISDRWVLTAGRNLFINRNRQATPGREPMIPKVYLGISHRGEANASNEVEVEKVVLHPGFQNGSDWDNDLALIQLKKPVTLGEKVIPIPLPEKDQDLMMLADRSGVIAGWGWGVYLELAQSLKHLVLPLVDHISCKAAFKKTNLMVDHRMFCTGSTKFGENVCFGDAGAALAIRDPRDGEVYAAGILSYDRACRTENYAVYMKISAYLPWIHKVLRGDKETFPALRSAVMNEMSRRQS